MHCDFHNELAMNSIAIITKKKKDTPALYKLQEHKNIIQRGTRCYRQECWHKEGQFQLQVQYTIHWNLLISPFFKIF